MQKINYDPLLTLLIHKKLKMVNLVENKVISWNIVRKINKNEAISMESIIKICDFLNCDIKDVVTVTGGSL